MDEQHWAKTVNIGVIRKSKLVSHASVKTFIQNQDDEEPASPPSFQRHVRRDSTENSSPDDSTDNFTRFMRQVQKGEKKRHSLTRHKTMDLSFMLGSKEKAESSFPALDEDEINKQLGSISFHEQTTKDSLLASLNGLSDIPSIPPLDKPPEKQTTLSNVLRSFAVKFDMNINGLRKAAKEKIEMKMNTKTKKSYQMEDQNICLCPFNDDLDQALFAVFDGHVDKNAAIEAKDLLPQIFTQELKNQGGARTSVTEVLKTTFRLVDEKMKHHQYEGCTATVVYIWKYRGNRYLQCANVGDSQAFLCRDENNNNTIELSQEHKVTNEHEYKRLEDAGIEMHSGKTRINGLAVSRSLGDHFIKECKEGLIGDPHISESYKLDNRDSLLIIATDGLWDVVSGNRAVEIVSREMTANDMAKKLLNTALESNKCRDNVTVVVATL